MSVCLGSACGDAGGVPINSEGGDAAEPSGANQPGPTSGDSQVVRSEEAATGPVAGSGGTDLGRIAADATDAPSAEPRYDCPDGVEFCEVAERAGLRDVVGYGRGTAFVDVDSDGWDDLFVTDTDDRHHPNLYGTSRVYRNLRDGTFERVDVGFASKDLDGTWVGAFGDYDNDGDPDVLIGNGGYTKASTLVFYENRMSTDGVFVDRTEASGVLAAAGGLASWWGATWADYDEDGFLDAAVTRRNGVPLLLHNRGDGSFEDVAAEAGIAPKADDSPDFKSPVFFDYDDDGDQDLYLAGIGRHALYRNLGEDGFIDVTKTVLDAFVPSAEPFVFSATVADFDQDGRDDLYLGRWDDQDLLLHNLGGGTFEALADGVGLSMSLTSSDDAAAYENTMGLGVGDLFEDGFPDIFIGTGNPVRASRDIFFCNEDGTSFTRCSSLFDDPDDASSLTRGHGIAVSDFDRDGDIDLFRSLGGHPADDALGHESPEFNRLHLRAGAAAHTAALVLEGVTSNRDAVGAVVRVEATATHHYRVRSTMGFQSQNSRVLTVTLGDGSEADVTVTWPSGEVTELTVAPGERLHVLEGTGVVP